MRVALIPLSCLVAAATFAPAAQAYDGYVVLAEQVPQAVAVEPVAQRVSRMTSWPAEGSAANLPECRRGASVAWRNADHASVVVECPQQWRAHVWIANLRRPVHEDCAAAAWRACLSKPGSSRRSGPDPIRRAALAEAIIDPSPR